MTATAKMAAFPVIEAAARTISLIVVFIVSFLSNLFTKRDGNSFHPTYCVTEPQMRWVATRITCFGVPPFTRHALVGATFGVAHSGRPSKQASPPPLPDLHTLPQTD